MKIEMQNINKKFGPVQVLFDVDFTLEKNAFHALVGENGAGKSTLMKILMGIEDYESGSITIDGNPVSFKSVLDAERNGIAIVNQELNIFPEMTVLDNLFISKEHKKGLIINEKSQRKTAQALFERLNISIDLDKRAKELSVGLQQMLEIGKALLVDSKVLVLDEPTSALTDKEIDNLFNVLNTLKKEGIAIIYISHRLSEIFMLCDTITVLRDGKKIITEATKKMTFDDVVNNMVGYELGGLIPPKPKVTLGNTLLEVKNLSKTGQFEPLDFSVREGEIIGFAGLMGSGRTEIMNALFGVTRKTTGNIMMHGNPVTIKNPVQAKALGFGYITENRKDEGLFLDFNIRDNILFNNFERVSRRTFIKEDKLEALTKTMTKTVNLRYRDFEQYIFELSGGNQQKVVLAKWLANNPKILIMDEPTRGIDVNSKKQIYDLIFKLKEQKLGVIVVSSELVELLGIADTIYVMHEGALKATLKNDNLTDKAIMQHMMGGTGYAERDEESK